MAVYVFEAMGQFVYVKLSGNNLMFSGHNTNYKFISLRKLAEKTGQDKEEVALVEEIARSLKDNEKLEQYIKSEFGRMGFSFSKKISEADYAQLTI